MHNVNCSSTHLIVACCQIYLPKVENFAEIDFHERLTSINR